MNLRNWARPINIYCDWVLKRAPYAAQRWADRLNSPDEAMVEGAVAEALVWNYLDDHDVSAELADSPGISNPDFRCSAAGGDYWVEVTNISSAAATQRTGLTPQPDGPGSFSLLTRAIKDEVTSKAGQFSTADLGAPLVIFVTTLHYQVSCLCVAPDWVEYLLYSEPKIAVPVRLDGSHPPGNPYQTTDMCFSVCTRNHSTEAARRHISAVVVGGFGLRWPDSCVLGVLHPDPIHAFDPEFLPRVPFCRFAKWPPGDEVQVEWMERRRSDRRPRYRKRADHGQPQRPK
jgi:hypothetical protein